VGLLSFGLFIGFVIWFPMSTLEAFLGSKQQFLKERTNGYYSV
jgi:hypothetical protein